VTPVQPIAVRLVDRYVHLDPSGTGEALPKDIGSSLGGDETVIWDPAVEGVLVSQADVTASSRHRGERHLDGDEVVYLVSGKARVSMENSDAAPTEISLSPGEALIVPKGAWHRLVIDEPSRMLVISRGRTEVRPPRR
jgi:quercetin dioxygenase-like cupin family protein